MTEFYFELSGLFLSAFISSTLAPGGSELLLVYLLNDGEIPVILLVITATLGNSLGAMSTWLLGFLVATKISSKRIEKSLSGQSIERINRWGAWVLLLSWLPVLGDGLCLAAGWLRLGLWRCVAAIVIGKALRYLAVVYLFASVAPQ